MRILHLTISLAPGGRRTAILTLAENLERLGVHCELGCLKNLGCSPEEAGHFPAPVTLFKKQRLVEAAAIERLASFCAEREIDLLHTHDADSQLAGALLKQRDPRLRIVMTFHRSLPIESRTFRDRVRNAFASAFCSAIITGSKERQQHYLSQNLVNRAKMIRIPFGVDVDRFHPNVEDGQALRQEMGIPADVCLVGAAGHFGEEKGLDLVIRAFQHLCEKRDPASLRLLVMGEGSPQQSAALHELAARHPQCRIDFTGFRGDVARMFRALDVFLHLPRLEAFGLVLIEAMSTGIPVVASSVGGIPEIVKHKRTGLLVPTESPEAAVEALSHLIDDPSRRTAMGRTGRDVALDEFTATLYAGRHLRLYEALLAGHAPRLAFPGADL